MQTSRKRISTFRFLLYYFTILVKIQNKKSSNNQPLRVRLTAVTNLYTVLTSLLSTSILSNNDVIIQMPSFIPYTTALEGAAECRRLHLVRVHRLLPKRHLPNGHLPKTNTKWTFTKWTFTKKTSDP